MLPRVGSYNIEAEVGRGGMGVVYRAADERLARTVAIKALPEDLSHDPARLERLEREARSMASVSHPNVAGIFGLEVGEDGRRYLILEFIEGETLADRLDRGPLPVDDALDLCVQIAAGLEAAHDANVIHRDLKPSNIKITPQGQIKVLDFGLAKGDTGASTSGSGLSQAVTATTPAARHAPTAEGAVLGTAAYMSPEQARGRGVDKRTDVWAFGVILYECLTGVGPFVGETATDSIGAVLHKHVDLNRLPPSTPPMVRHVLARCLERDKARRFRDIADVRIELERAREDPHAQTAMIPGANASSRAAWLGWLVALLALAAAAVVFTLSPGNTATERVVRTSIIGPEGWEIDDASISADGTRILAVCDEIDQRSGITLSDEWLFVRDLASDEWVKVEGSLETWHAAFSPDGKSIAFLADHPDLANVYELKRVPTDLSQPPVTIGELTDANLIPSRRWFAWTPDGNIVFSLERDKVLRIVDPGTGNTVRDLTLTGEFDGDCTLAAFGGPFGPDHLAVGVTGFSKRGYQEDVAFIDLATGQRRTVVPGARGLQLLPDGSVLFGRSDSIYHSGWDAQAKALAGQLRVVLTGVLVREFWGNASCGVSQQGDLLFLTGGIQGSERRIVVATPDGEERVWGQEGRPYEDQISLSSDAERFAVIVVNARGTFELWAGEVNDNRLRRLHGSESFDVLHPRFSADGQWVFVTEAGSEHEALKFIRLPFDGSGAPETLWSGGSYANFYRLQSVNPDGARFLFDRNPDGDPRVVELDLRPDQADGGTRPMRELMPNLNAWNATYDPLGLGLIAYVAAPGGRRELFVRSIGTQGSTTLGPAEGVTREFDYYKWVVEPAEVEGAAPRLYLWDLSLQRGFSRTEVMLDAGRVRLSERVSLSRPPLRDAFAGDLAHNGTEIIVRRGDNEGILERVELVQGALAGLKE